MASRKIPVNRKEYTTEEVAELSGVTRRTVYAWITGGFLPAQKRGPKMWRVLGTDLDEFLNRRWKEEWAIEEARKERAEVAKLNRLSAAGRPAGPPSTPLHVPEPQPEQLELPKEMQPEGSGKIIPAPRLTLGAPPVASQPSREQRRRIAQAEKAKSRK